MFTRSLIISNPQPHLLVISKSRLASSGSLAFLALFWIGWYTSIGMSPLSLANPAMWIFYFAPLLSIPEIFRLIKVVTRGEVFELDKDLKTISKDNMRIADFEDVVRVQIRKITDSDNDVTYRLSIALNTGTKISIDHSSDQKEIAEVADDLADVLGVSVVNKE